MSTQGLFRTCCRVVGAILGADRKCIGPKAKVIGGLTCKRVHWNSQEMRQMLEDHPDCPSIGNQIAFDHQPLALPYAGIGHRGTFSLGTGNKRFLLVGTDYLTKWVEAVLLTNIVDSNVKMFIWRNIVTRSNLLIGQ